MKESNEQLVARFQAGDADALAELIQRNRGLVFQAIFRYRGQAEQECHEDLIQAGDCALWRAAQKFDPARGLKFTTLAWHCVNNKVKAETQKHSTIYTPRICGVYDSQKRMARSVVRLDDKDEDGFGHDLADSREATAESLAELDEELRLFSWAMSRLPERRRAILQSRLAGRTLDDVGLSHGISKERVRQIEAEAIAGVKALVLARSGQHRSRRLSDDEHTYIRLTRQMYSTSEIASDLRRTAKAVERVIAGLGKWKKGQTCQEELCLAKR